jgi:hypothetical protein
LALWNQYGISMSRNCGVDDCPSPDFGQHTFDASVCKRRIL